MHKILSCECTPVVDTLVVCSPVMFHGANFECIYLGPGGAYAVIAENETTDVAHIRDQLCLFCSSSRVWTYHRRTGHTVAPDNSHEQLLSDCELLCAIYEHTLHGPHVWDEPRIQQLQDQFRLEDARHRGVYRNSDGTWHLARRGKFYPMSDLDPNRILRLALLGGVLGLHRFAMGKWFTGLIYLLTGGFLGLGWLLDLMQLTMGSMRDKEKRLIPKPDSVGLSWILAGAVSSFALFCLYGILSGAITESLSQLIVKMLVDRVQSGQ